MNKWAALRWDFDSFGSICGCLDDQNKLSLNFQAELGLRIKRDNINVKARNFMERKF